MLRSTTILAVLKDGKAAVAGDGQVTLGETIVKHGARKVRRIHQGNVIAGFAGSAADGFTLFERLEGKLEEFRGNLPRASVELAKEWRLDRALRRLDAFLIAVDSSHLFVISGSGDVIEPDDGIAAIGSGGPYALAAARALLRHTGLSVREVVEESLRIASTICIYTNSDIIVEEL
ncbi:MAG TPA: ATP-dependent protease subunit HslV [Firmicutes bacterium]|nr:ATP-dependent protease subunit HslV [Bacillota bacterium]HHY99152.1 ATP-dependent protease subunit HslV [Bacillota bacterium]